jgi:hypothetical protein
MTQVDTGIRVHKPRHPPAAWERLIARLLQIAFASFVHVGTLRVVTAGGDDFTVGDGSGKPLAIRFASTAAQLAVLLDPDLRFGESYVDGSLVVEEGSIDDVLALALSQDISSRPTRWETPQWLVRYLCRRIGQFNFRDRAQRTARARKASGMTILEEGVGDHRHEQDDAGLAADPAPAVSRRGRSRPREALAAGRNDDAKGCGVNMPVASRGRIWHCSLQSLTGRNREEC